MSRGVSGSPVRALMALAVGIVLVAMGWTWFQYLRAEGARPQLELVDVAGDVRLDRGDAQGAAARGTVLQADDRVATGADGRAVLLLGRETQIRVGPTSALQITGVDEAGVSLELEDGALQATVRPESGAVRVGNRGREVLATSGEFAVGVSGDVLKVDARRGALSLSGVDRTRLDEGEQATVVGRRAEVAPIPEELLLAVDWPQEARTRSEVTRITGSTQPGARVHLRGSFGVRTVLADADGRFVAEVPLAEGDNRITVEAVDILGQVKAVDGLLQSRDTVGPSFRGGVDYSGGR